MYFQPQQPGGGIPNPNQQPPNPQQQAAMARMIVSREKGADNMQTKLPVFSFLATQSGPGSTFSPQSNVAECGRLTGTTHPAGLRHTLVKF